MEKLNFQSLKNKGKRDIKEAKDLEELDVIFRKYLGKKGEITKILASLKEISKEKRAGIGKKANDIKSFLREEINKKACEIKDKIDSKKEKSGLDVTLPGKKMETGHLHPLTSIRREVEGIFNSIGFSVVKGPHIETEWYNFDALNIPQNHPSRDLWDTFWLKKKLSSKNLLLRTHTSPVQIRYMKKYNPPIRIIAPGRVFRHEASDASHDVQFYQVEGLMINKDISVADFKGVIQEFLKRFFKKKIETRLRPGFFPFTEPSFEIDIKCLICGGKGCSTCGKTGWVELCPGGMVHPNVLKAGGLNPNNWQGFAFGLGFDRLVMMRHRINDIRLLYSGDLRFLKQF
jgi:phenylalanyl-tRNA synthetase alpha chain